MLLWLIVVCGGIGIASGQAVTSKEAIDTVVVELSPYGFMPKEIQRKKPGKFYLFMRVNPGQDPTSLRLEAENGTALKQVDLPATGKRWGNLVDVQKGKYSIKVSGKPQFVLDITVP